MNTLIVIPNYNHNSLCDQLISKINDYDLLVIDDGSDNKYIPSVNKNNIKVIRNTENCGKGYCIKLGARFAKDNEYKNILVIDADMQHEPTKIHSFISMSEDYDFIYGKRNFDSNMPFLRKLSNTITSYIISKMCKISIKDTQCGFRLYNLSLFDDLHSLEDGYQFESEILLNKINSSSKISHVDIPTIYNESKSSIRNFSDTNKFIKLVLRNIR